MAEEGLQKTDNDLIHIGNPIYFDRDCFLRQLSALMDAAYGNKANIRELVAGMVSTYHPEGVTPARTEPDNRKRQVDESDQ